MSKFTIPDLRYEETFVVKCRANSGGSGPPITNLAIFKTIISNTIIDPFVQSFFMAFALAKLQPVFILGRKMGALTINSVKSSFNSIFKISNI